LIPLVLLFFSPGPGLSGQSAEPAAVLVESSPEYPVLDDTWRISILVDHPVPEEVTVTPPELPSSLTFARSRKETRFIREEGRNWTLAEFLFVPHRTGAITLGSFEVLAPGYRAKTGELRTYVAAKEGAPEEYRPRLVWDAPPAALSIGEGAELTLRVLDWDPGKALRPSPFRTTAPADAILEELPLTKNDLDQRRVLRVRITPLRGGVVSLGPFTLRLDTLALEAPAISIRLRPPVPGNAAPGAAVPAIPAAVPAPNPAPAEPPPFPEIRDEPFPFFRKASGETLDRSRELWSRACYAEALGELRRGERDLLAGPKLAATRRAAEQALGLSVMPATPADEKWRPRNFILALIVLAFCLMIPAIWLTFRQRGSPGKKGVISIIVLIGVLGFSLLKAFSSGKGEGSPLETSTQETGYLGRGVAVRGSTAVLRACAAYRVPDIQGAISVRWKEGQPVKVRTAADQWTYAESPDGDAGWVRQENLVFY
jgi:hypothetical protein